MPYNFDYGVWCCHGDSVLKDMFSCNLNFLCIFYIKLDCDAWDWYFGNLEHYCFKKMLSLIFSVDL